MSSSETRNLAHSILSNSKTHHTVIIQNKRNHIGILKYNTYVIHCFISVFFETLRWMFNLKVIKFRLIFQYMFQEMLGTQHIVWNVFKSHDIWFPSHLTPHKSAGLFLQTMDYEWFLVFYNCLIKYPLDLLETKFS